ncbi:MAG TPA: hypothetical protein VOA87_09580 [Thermoanaerobaculia bacterium]|nr:hypothetical protein [Thermoanaerobaculia bacterium]
MSAIAAIALLCLVLAAPLAARPRPDCGMSCCRLAAPQAACAARSACSLKSCGGTSEAASLPTLPLSVLASLPRLAVPAPRGFLARRLPASLPSLSPAPPEHPPRA